jgi:S-layer family protein
MTASCRRSTTFLFASLLAISATRAAAQDDPASQSLARKVALQPKDFGIQDEGITVIDFTAFLPNSSTIEYASNFRERWTTAGGTSLIAPVTGIPDGATLTQIVFYFRDDSFFNFEGSFRRWWVDSSTGANADFDFPVTLTSDGSPGETSLSTAVNIPIRYRYDIDGDGIQEVVSYQISVLTIGADGDIAIRGARLTWRRNVSPAPANATFNDVPTSDGGFQFIEALVASGITAGCGGGNYCPDAPLTRRQMAVFLAKALGLHWAPFAP